MGLISRVSSRTYRLKNMNFLRISSTTRPITRTLKCTPKYNQRVDKISQEAAYKKQEAYRKYEKIKEFKYDIPLEYKLTGTSNPGNRLREGENATEKIFSPEEEQILLKRWSKYQMNIVNDQRKRMQQ